MSFLLEPKQRKIADDILLLENVRCAISFLFELDLNKRIDDAEKLYLRHYRPLGIKQEDAGLWVLDSFRTLDPVYIHNYVLGDAVASETIRFLKTRFGTDLPRWGEWIRKNYLACGSRKSFGEKISLLPTGRFHLTGGI